MKVTRKFSLDRIGHRYESVTVEVEGENIDDIAKRIDDAWKAYCKLIAEGKVQ